MQITVTVNSLKELQEIMDTLVILDESVQEEKVKKKRSYRVDREAVAAAISQGYTNKEIADLLDVAYSSVCNIARELRGAQKEV